MAYTLVGTIGAPSQGAVTTSVTPAYGQTPTAGNLLICFCSVTANAGSPAIPSGWSFINNAVGTGCSATIFYKIAAGADAAPTLAAVTGGLIAGQLAEFTGNSSTPFDQVGGNSGGGTSLIATFGAADAASGELMTISTADWRSVARSPNDILTSNHATITQAGNNNAVSSVNHYSFGYSLATTSNSGADTATLTPSVTTSINGLVIFAVTFKLAPPLLPLPELIQQPMTHRRRR